MMCCTAVLQVQDYQLYKVIVQVEDVNDNAPVFHQNSFVLNVSEDTRPGTRFPLPVADDIDSEQYAVVEYRLEPSEMQRIFTLHVITEADLSQQVCRRSQQPRIGFAPTNHNLRHTYYHILPHDWSVQSYRPTGL